jgi:hypothetical protein
MIGHWVQELIPDASLAGEPDWSQRLRLDLSPWAHLYYALKFDHLVCVPAIICLYLGTRGLALIEEMGERQVSSRTAASILSARSASNA